jgi:hypothetical protein
MRLSGEEGTLGKITPSGSYQDAGFPVVSRSVEQLPIGGNRRAIDNADEDREAQPVLAVLERADERDWRRRGPRLAFSDGKPQTGSLRSGQAVYRGSA